MTDDVPRQLMALRSLDFNIDLGDILHGRSREWDDTDNPATKADFPYLFKIKSSEAMERFDEAIEMIVNRQSLSEGGRLIASIALNIEGTIGENFVREPSISKSLENITLKSESNGIASKYPPEEDESADVQEQAGISSLHISTRQTKLIKPRTKYSLDGVFRSSVIAARNISFFAKVLLRSGTKSLENVKRGIYISAPKYLESRTPARRVKLNLPLDQVYEHMKFISRPGSNVAALMVNRLVNYISKEEYEDAFAGYGKFIKYHGMLPISLLETACENTNMSTDKLLKEYSDWRGTQGIRKIEKFLHEHVDKLEKYVPFARFLDMEYFKWMNRSEVSFFKELLKEIIRLTGQAETISKLETGAKVIESDKELVRLWARKIVEMNK